MREEGYYWVKYQGEWIIAEWAKLSKHCWFRTGYNDVLPLKLITEIDERRITRPEPEKEYPKCPDPHCECTGECQASFTANERTKKIMFRR